MRTHKFKIWDTEEKKWVINPQVEFIHEEKSWGNTFYLELEDDWYSDRYIFIEWTGLKDKNFKDIYDGDIVNRNTGYPPRIVTWKPKGRYTGWFASKPEDGTPYNTIDHLPLDIDGKEVEVIGNIYDNPELLK